MHILGSVCLGIPNGQAIHHGARLILFGKRTMNSGLSLFKNIELGGNKPRVAHFWVSTSFNGPLRPFPHSVRCPSPTASTCVSSMSGSPTSWAANFNELSSEVKDTNKRLDKFEKKSDETDSKIDQIHRLLMGKRKPAKNKRKPASGGRVFDDHNGEKESVMNEDGDLQYDGVFTDQKISAAAEPSKRHRVLCSFAECLYCCSGVRCHLGKIEDPRHVVSKFDPVSQAMRLVHFPYASL